MPEHQKKARDIKDLKARLGRGGSAGSVPPGGAGTGVPAPAAGVPAPMGVPAPGVPGGGIPGPGFPGLGAKGGAIPAPFGQPAAQEQPQARARSADPFAAQAAVAAPNEVRLVIDDKSDVTAAEVGRKSAGKVVMAAVSALVAGIALGALVGSTARERQLWNLILHDAKDIYALVNEASGTVSKAQQLVNTAVKAAAPAPGKPAAPDFKSLEALRALEKPFKAGAFSRKHYRAFSAGTVDSLFNYYNNVNLIWQQIQTLSAKALPKSHRKELEESATTASDFATKQYGCVPFEKDKQFGCGMVSLTPGAEGKISVTSFGRSFDKEPYTGQDLSSHTSNYVILIDKARSKEFLGQGGNAFQDYARSLVELKKLTDGTVEVQGRLIRELGEIAKNESL